ncbi:flavin monoamine oxidase family protein [Nocardia panacis]|nr:NAD(P)/FAD-dependent oxidoreductase [Nocardia panacis]
MVQRTVTEYMVAERLGIPVDEVRAPIFDRRTLLKAGVGAAVFAGLAGRQPAVAQSLGPDTPRIAIIGAGIAGLNAALTLADAGIAATVYEARGRVGGRMFSEREYWDGGQVSEYGGEGVDSDHHTIRNLCSRFGIPLVDTLSAAPAGSSPVLYFDGGYVPRDKFIADFEPVFRALQVDAAACPATPTWNSATPAGIALSTMSLTEWIATRVPGGYSNWIARLFDDAYVVEYGMPTADQTALNLVSMMKTQKSLDDPRAWGNSDEQYKISGGSQRLPRAIAEALPDGAIRYEWRLEAIVRDSDGGQTLIFDDAGTRRTVRADHTILAVPVGVLKHIDYSAAGFDPRMTGVIDALPMSTSTKLNMQFTSRPWVGRGQWPGVSNGASFTDVGYQAIWDATAGQPGKQGIAIQYGGGLDARGFAPPSAFPTAADLAVRTRVGTVLAQFERVVPGIGTLWNGRATLSAWHADPLANGAYSAMPTNYSHRFFGYEGARQGNIHFAGEHTSSESQGYMNGGAESGARAAREILSDLGR